MDRKRLVFLLAFSAGVGGFVACGSGGGGRVVGPDGAPTFTFSGTVKVGVTGLAGVQVFLSGDVSRTAQTDGQGGFTFAGVSGKSFVVTPSLGGYLFTPSNYAMGPNSRTDLNFAATAVSRPGVVLNVGDIAPDFTAIDQNGQTVSLYSYRGKVVLIDFSADWCGSCRAEAPQLESLYERYKDQGFQAVTILTSGSAAAWAATFKVTHPVIEQKGESWSTAYGAGFLPLNVVIDKTMTIRWKSKQDWDYEYDEAETLAVIKQYF